MDGYQYLKSIRKLDFDIFMPENKDVLWKIWRKAIVRMRKGGRDRHIISNSDKRHTIRCLHSLKYIMDKEGFAPEERLITNAALMIHDMAYPITKDFAEFTGEIARRRHMNDACHEFNKWDIPLTTAQKAEVMIIVCQHDNPSIGERFWYTDKKMLAHRVADRSWMIDKAGFAMDLLRMKVPSPHALLGRVLEEHAQEGVREYLESGNELFQLLERERREEYGIWEEAS